MTVVIIVFEIILWAPICTVISFIIEFLKQPISFPRGSADEVPKPDSCGRCRAQRAATLLLAEQVEARRGSAVVGALGYRRARRAAALRSQGEGARV